MIHKKNKDRLSIVRCLDSDGFESAFTALHRTLDGATVKAWGKIQIAQLVKYFPRDDYGRILDDITASLPEFPTTISCKTGDIIATEARPDLYPRINLTLSGDSNRKLHGEAESLHTLAGVEYTRPTDKPLFVGLGFVVVENNELYCASLPDALQAAQELIPSDVTFGRLEPQNN